MNATHAFREGIANACANYWTLAVMTLVSLLALFGPPIWELHTTDQLFDHQQDLLDRGYYTIHISPSADGDAINAGDCRRHQQLTGVIAAGGATNVNDSTWWSTNGPQQSTWAVDNGLLRHLLVIRTASDTAAWSGQQIFVDTAVREQISPPYERNLIVEGTQLQGTTLELSASSAGAGFRNSVIWPDSRETYDLCVLLAEPESLQSLYLGLRAAYIDSADVAPALAGIDPQRDPTLMFSQRTSRYGWAFGAGVWTVIVLFFARLRRADSGLYRLLGASRPSVGLTIWTETMVSVALSLVPGVIAVATIQSQHPHASSTAATASALLSTASILGGALIGAVSIAASRTIGLLKEG